VTNQTDIDIRDAYDLCTLARESIGHMNALFLAIKQDTASHTAANSLARLGCYLASDFGNNLDCAAEDLGKALRDPFEGTPGEDAHSSEFEQNAFEDIGGKLGGIVEALQQAQVSHHLVALAEACEILAFASSNAWELALAKQREAVTCTR
jgi:hypothetical protein